MFLLQQGSGCSRNDGNSERGPFAHYHLWATEVAPSLPTAVILNNDLDGSVFRTKLQVI